MGYPRFVMARNFKKTKRTAGNLTANSTTWADVDNALDIVLAAQVGDTIEASINMMVGLENTDLFIDVVSVVSAAPVTSFGQGTAPASAGTGGWHATNSVVINLAGSCLYTVQAGDLSSGYITCRLRYRTYSAVNKTIRAGDGSNAGGTSSQVESLYFFAKNLGPVDPN